MAVKGYFFNAVKTGDTYDRVYTAQDMVNYLNALVGNGVFPNPSNQLQVVINTGMNVAVKKGLGWINGHKIDNDSDLILAIDPSDVLLSRIDSVVFFYDYTLRDVGIIVKKGTSSVNPVAPSVVRNDYRYEMQVATIRIDKQVTTISQSMITDTRGLSSVCGWVQGLIQQASTETLFTQWQTAYIEAIQKDQYDFDKWFADVKQHLASATLIRQFTSSYKTVTANQTVIPINIEQFNLNLDILNCFINGMKLIQDVDYTKDSNTQITLKKPIDKVGTQIEFEIFKSVDGSDAEKVIVQVEKLQKDVTALNTKTDNTNVDVTELGKKVNQVILDVGDAIDGLQKNKADKKAIRVTINTSNWTLNSGDGYYHYNAPVSIVTNANDLLFISPDPVSVENYGGVYANSQSVGFVDFKSKAKPTTILYVNVVNMGVVA